MENFLLLPFGVTRFAMNLIIIASIINTFRGLAVGRRHPNETEWSTDFGHCCFSGRGLFMTEWKIASYQQ